MAAARTWKELEMAEVWSKKSPLNQEELVSLLKILPELLNKLFDRYTQFKRSSVHVDFTALRRTALLFKAEKRDSGVLPTAETPWGTYRAVRSCSSPTLVLGITRVRISNEGGSKSWRRNLDFPETQCKENGRFPPKDFRNNQSSGNRKFLIFVELEIIPFIPYCTTAQGRSLHNFLRKSCDLPSPPIPKGNFPPS